MSHFVLKGKGLDIAQLDKGEQEAYFNVVEQGRKAAKERFETKPSEATLDKYISSYNTGTSKEEWKEILKQEEEARKAAQKTPQPQERVVATTPASPEEIMEEVAMQHMQSRGRQQVKQKHFMKNFTTELSNPEAEWKDPVIK